MTAGRVWILAAWLCCLLLAAAAALRARYVADLSAFLPARPTPAQRLLIEQLRDGPGSRLVMLALAGGSAVDRAALSSSLAAVLRTDARFASVDNGEQVTAQRDREVLFAHRYLLSEAVAPGHFAAAGLRRALEDTLADLASPIGLAVGPLALRDPTGEMLSIVERLTRNGGPRTSRGVWTSADGAHALLIAETAAAGSDTDAQESSLAAIRAAFERVSRGGVELLMSGPGVIAVAARARIERAVVRLSLAAGLLVAGTLLAVYRSPVALLLGLLPVATGALVGVAAVALGFGVVHGVTLGFGITLIGEAVDYAIYFFIQSAGGAATPRGARGSESEAQAWSRLLWPTLRLGMLTSVIGFAALVPSGFPGLAQLGAYSVSGLLAAAAVTRFVLPVVLPRRFTIRDLTPAGVALERGLRAVSDSSAARLAIGCGTLSLGACCLGVLLHARPTLWDRDLASLSPMSSEAERLDARLRGELGAADSLDLVVVSGDSLDAALRGAELAARALEPLIDAAVIGGFDSPATFLPSAGTQLARRASLPDRDTLERNLAEATRGLALDAGRLGAFEDDLQDARRSAPIAAADLEGTSMHAALGALTMRGADGWSALLPLHPPTGRASGIDLAAVRRALALAHADARAIDLKHESDALYGDYLREAMRLCAAGLAAIVLLLWVALKSVPRAARVLAPLALAVLSIAAALVLCGVRLNLLHLVGLLLIVAVGSNYALFFDARRHGAECAPTTLASLCIANACTVLGFGVLSFAGVPVLEALGTTVAPGAILALLFAALLIPPPGRGPAAAPSAARA